MFRNPYLYILAIIFLSCEELPEFPTDGSGTSEIDPPITTIVTASGTTFNSSTVTIQWEGNESARIFDYRLEYEDTSISTVRLSASTIEQLFKDTNYNLKDVRKNKLVKPINLELLPNEMKMIENVKQRKTLFIQIVLPLILEENNQIKLDRKKLFAILNKNNNSNAEKNG